MKRFAPLLLIVLALAAVPVAAADDSAPSRPNAHPGVQLQILRLQLQLVHLRYRIVCHKQDSDRCAQFTQKIVNRLTKLDGNVQQKLGDLKACTPDSTDAKCKNADKKITVLTRIDTHLQKVIQNIQNWINGKSSDSSSSTSDSSLDQAASNLSQAAAGANG